MKFPDGTFLEQFQTIIQTLPDIIYKIDRKGLFTYINNAVTLIGYNPEELVGKHFRILFNEEDAEKISRDLVIPKYEDKTTGKKEQPKLFDERRTGNRITRNLRIKVKHNDVIKEMAGEIIAAGVYEENESGVLRYAGTIGVIRNIDEVDKSEHALILAEKHYRNLIGNLTEIVLIIATDGTVLFITDSSKKTLGYESVEIIGENIYNYIHKEDAGQVSDRIWLMSTEAINESKFSIRVINRSKEWLYFKVNMKKIVGHDNQMACLLINAVNNTEQINLIKDIRAESYLRKSAEKEKAAALFEVQRASQAKSEFISTMSHEIRNPLNIVLGFIDLIAENNKDESINDDIFSMKYAGRELLGIVNQVLNFSKIESGKNELDVTVFNLNEMFDFIKTLFQVDLYKKNIAFNVIKNKSFNFNVMGDRQKLTQVITNIISNAIKFTDNGTITLNASYDDKILKIQISDTGIGIPSEKLKYIFNPFYQVDSSTSRKYGGTGLGLSIASGMVRCMNGKIDVESEVGKGTSFQIIVPIGLVHSQDNDPNIVKFFQLNDESIKNFLIKTSGKAFKILIAEDDDNNRKLIRKLLKNSALNIETAENGKIALEMIEREEFNLLLLDMHMPVIDGFGVLKVMREKSFLDKLPVVVLTGHVIEGFDEECIAQGCIGMIPKPIDIHLLYKYINNAIDWWVENN